ncbi:hypothetical protein [Thauera phenylacetica]|uniref:hypothetical protein n=1 Tax=Thauera phenylacetica TaxID=164400 RepID=UPI0012FA754F|nr:hypothetical protein [Thauera phenylacetica]
MVIEMKRGSPLFAAFSDNREAFVTAIKVAVDISAKKMGADAASLFSLRDGRLSEAKQKAA